MGMVGFFTFVSAMADSRTSCNTLYFQNSQEEVNIIHENLDTAHIWSTTLVHYQRCPINSETNLN
ncbi:MAG TPA: hypothetical protein DEF18_08530 [Muricauda sp.]|nr:hypothetical protein [Allomuricauda sp.]MBC73415.1 hypothetical protein [Allomuricauda sp.]HBU78133.1 hypothetical protein [Allomuricauda sp.]